MREGENAVIAVEEIQNLGVAYQYLEERLKQRDHEFENLQTEADKFRLAGNSLEVDKEGLGEETLEPKRQLQDSKDRSEVLSQELAARDKSLDEINQARQALGEDINPAKGAMIGIGFGLLAWATIIYTILAFI